MSVAPPVLGLLWAVFVLAVAGAGRPAPARVRLLYAPTPAITSGWRRHDLRLVVGRATRRLVGDGNAGDVVAARRLGGAVLAAVVATAAVPAWPPVAPAIAAAAAWWWPAHRTRQATRRRTDAIAAAVPDVVDLFLLAVDAGLTVPLAVRAVARRARDGPLTDELRRLVGDLELGRRTADAIDDLAAAHRGGDTVRPLTAILAASERYGAPLADGLARLAHDARLARRRRAEETARRLPVTLLFPLVLCTLPAFGLLTVGPLVASALESLRL